MRGRWKKNDWEIKDAGHQIKHDNRQKTPFILNSKEQVKSILIEVGSLYHIFIFILT